MLREVVAMQPVFATMTPPLPATDVWALARAAHPGLPDDREAFVAFVVARAPAETLAGRAIADLYLAWACARGDTTALASFERDIVPVVARSLASFAEYQEVLQILREQMLVARAGTARRGIEAYDGRAPLTVWLRVCATRIGLREQARARRGEPLDDDRFDQLAPGVPDPELAYLRRLYGASFRTAFSAAVATLASRERNLLRMSVIDGLGIDQLAKIFHIHRSTVARRLELVRAELVAATRDRMRRSLAISDSELDSVMRVLTDLTLRHALTPQSRKSE